MDIMIKLPVIILLIFIVAALARSMYCLARDDGARDKAQVVQALTIRIVLSFILFAVLIGGYLTGIVQPHGL